MAWYGVVANNGICGPVSRVTAALSPRISRASQLARVCVHTSCRPFCLCHSAYLSVTLPARSWRLKRAAMFYLAFLPAIFPIIVTTTATFIMPCRGLLRKPGSWRFLTCACMTTVTLPVLRPIACLFRRSVNYFLLVAMPVLSSACSICFALRALPCCCVCTLPSYAALCCLELLVPYHVYLRD